MDIIEVGSLIEQDIRRRPIGERKRFDRAYARIQRAAKKHGDFGLGAILLSAARECQRAINAAE